MKNIFIISFLSLLIASCSTTTKISQSDTKQPIVEQIECSTSSIKKGLFTLTNGKEISSNRKYCYVWQLETQDSTVVLSKTGISSNTKYISWPQKSVIVIKNGNTNDYLSASDINLYKFTNESNFSVSSEKIQVKSSFYLEQFEDDIYVSLVNKYVFKNTDILYINKDLSIPDNTELDIKNNLKLKLGETVSIKIPSPYVNDTNKFYQLKFTINAFD